MSEHDEPADFDNEEVGDEGENDFEPVFETVDPDKAGSSEKQVTAPPCTSSLSPDRTYVSYVFKPSSLLYPPVSHPL